METRASNSGAVRTKPIQLFAVRACVCAYVLFVAECHRRSLVYSFARLCRQWDDNASLLSSSNDDVDDASTTPSTRSSVSKSYNYRPIDLADNANAPLAPAARGPQSVALASAFKQRSLAKWEEAKTLRADPILPELERLALAIASEKRSTSESSAAAAEFAAANSASAASTSAAAVDVFRLRSKHSWEKQRTELRSQAASAPSSSSSDKSDSSASSESIALKLYRQGYGLGSSSSGAAAHAQVIGGSETPAPLSSSFRDASRDAWRAAKVLRSELASDAGLYCCMRCH